MIQPASGAATSLVADAHAAGLKVHPWTFRAENFFLLPALRTAGGPAEHGRLAGEIGYFIGLGVDGIIHAITHI